MNPANHARIPPSSPMNRFLLVSMMIHLVLLATWHDRIPISFVDPHNKVLSVVLPDRTPAPVSSQATPGRPAQEKPVFFRPAKESSADGRFQPEAADMTTSSESLQQSVMTGPDTVTTPVETVLVRVQSRLLSDIKRHFHYPLLARQRGWEGTVLLGLRVEPDGHLEKIRIERSSGYAVLDHSALNSLHRLGQVAGVSAWLNGRSVDMQLPVIYRLIED